ncbi:MAG: hypothetical protein PHH36_06460 [Sideroxydans sp.]|nr:hypothetical protein [Sideroxydans sp.]
MPSCQSSNHGSKFQHGGALLVMLVILVMGITTVFVTSLSGPAISNKRNQTTSDALARAKEALIGYAISYGDTHPANPVAGYLPCPDIGTTEGTAPSECSAGSPSKLGRLPWRTLDLSALFDGTGECLWYAVSGNYSDKSLGLPMNWDTSAQLHVFDSNGNELEAGEVVAVILAPGIPLSHPINSDRSVTTNSICGGDYTGSAYLDYDSEHGINNSDISAAQFIIPHEHRDGNGNVTSSTNDQITYITRQDIWNGIQKRIARQAKKCLDDYAADASNPNHKYPWAVSLSNPDIAPNRTGTVDLRFGRFPDTPNTSTSGSASCPPNGSNLTTLSAAQITTLNNYIDQVSTALSNYKNSPSSTTRNNLQDAGDNLWSLVKNSPYNLPTGDAIRSQLGYYLENNCTSSSCYSLIPTIEQRLADAISEFNSCTGSGGTDSSMPSSWTSISSCNDLVTSASWSAWRDWLFIQIADGYQPGGSGSCTPEPDPAATCLSISGSGHTNAGSGSYHAVVVAASKSLPSQSAAARISSPNDLTNYLDKDSAVGAPMGDNQTGKTNPPTSTSFTTYRPSDSSYSTINDFVLCIDGKNNCP